MDKLRDETLAEILKKEKAYPHEIRSIIPELIMLRDIYDGKRPKEDYAKTGDYLIVVPRTLIEDDIKVGAATAVAGNLHSTYLVYWPSAFPHNRYILHRVK